MLVFFCIADPSRAHHGSVGENSPTYIDVRPRIHRTLIFALRNEDDPMNLYLTLGKFFTLEFFLSFDASVSLFY